jgi:PTS system mannose-specific IIC component
VSYIDVFPVALLGGLLGLDVVSFPQAMFSRPIVAATLAGALLGNGGAGLIIGAVLELIALETLPFGASRYPEWGSASVVGGAIFVHDATSPAGAMALAMVGALATAMVSGWSMVKLRELNAHWARRHRAGLDAGSRGTVVGLQLIGMTADFARGAALTALGVVLLTPTMHAALQVWGFDARISRAAAIAVAASIALAAAWKILHATPGARWLFGAGIALGLAILATR